MGLLGSAVDAVKGGLSKVGGLYKKGFSLYKTDNGKLGLLIGCQLAGGGPLCTAAAQYQLADKYGNLTPKGAKLLNSASKAPPAGTSKPPAEWLPWALVGGGVVLVLLAASMNRSKS